MPSNASTKTIKSVMNGKIIVVSNDDSINTPLFCVVCSYPMKSIDDSIAYRKSGCCNYCDMRFGTPKEGPDGWDIKNGRYPKKDTEIWADYIQLKSLSFTIIFNIR